MTGPELKTLRDRAGLTQEELAQKCSKSIGWLRRRESGEVPIDGAWGQFFTGSLSGAPLRSWSGAEVHQLREGYNLSQMGFAAQVGVSKLSVGRWERGVAAPSEGNIFKLNEMRAKLLKERT